jgi:hypothetical protein
MMFQIRARDASLAPSVEIVGRMLVLHHVLVLALPLFNSLMRQSPLA